MGNIEGPILSPDAVKSGNYMHFTDASRAQWLWKHNIRIWNLANNHMLDYEDQGVQSTVACAEELNCMTLGAGADEAAAHKPVILPENGGIGIVSVTYSAAKAASGACRCFHWDELDAIRMAIADVRKTCRWCIMLVHGGDEFAMMPMPYTRKRYLAYLDMGVDVIVGHHPHVVQNYEVIGSKIIFYSLGNFIFDTDYQRAQNNTENGILLRLRFSEDKISWDSLPVVIDRENQTVTEGICSPIDVAAYTKLWPHAAEGLLYAERRMNSFLNPGKYNRFSPQKWTLREIYGCKTVRGRILLHGKIKAMLRPKKKAQIVQFLRKG